MWSLTTIGAKVLQKLLDQNHTCEQEAGLCDKSLIQIVFIFIMKFNAKFHQIFPVFLEKKLILLFLQFLVIGDTFKIFHMTQFYYSETLKAGHAPSGIWEL